MLDVAQEVEKGQDVMVPSLLETMVVGVVQVMMTYHLGEEVGALLLPYTHFLLVGVQEIPSWLMVELLMPLSEAKVVHLGVVVPLLP